MICRRARLDQYEKAEENRLQKIWCFFNMGDLLEIWCVYSFYRTSKPKKTPQSNSQAKGAHGHTGEAERDETIEKQRASSRRAKP